MTRKEPPDYLHTPQPGESLNEFVRRVKRERQYLIDCSFRDGISYLPLEPIEDFVLDPEILPTPTINQADQHGQETPQDR